MQKQMWSLWLLEVLWQQWFPSSATSQSQSMTPHQGESLRSSGAVYMPLLWHELSHLRFLLHCMTDNP